MVLHKSKNGQLRGCGFPPRHLKLMHWNVEGIFSKTHGNKLNDSDFLKKIVGEDIIALTETHVSEEMWDSGMLEILGYVFK